MPIYDPSQVPINGEDSINRQTAIGLKLFMCASTTLQRHFNDKYPRNQAKNGGI
jgi:hypothetical protein